MFIFSILLFVGFSFAEEVGPPPREAHIFTNKDYVVEEEFPAEEMLEQSPQYDESDFEQVQNYQYDDGILNARTGEFLQGKIEPLPSKEEVLALEDPYEFDEGGEYGDVAKMVTEQNEEEILNLDTGDIIEGGFPVGTRVHGMPVSDIEEQEMIMLAEHEEKEKQPQQVQTIDRGFVEKPKPARTELSVELYNVVKDIEAQDNATKGSARFATNKGAGIGIKIFDNFYKDLSAYLRVDHHRVTFNDEAKTLRASTTGSTWYQGGLQYQVHKMFKVFAEGGAFERLVPNTVIGNILELKKILVTDAVIGGEFCWEFGDFWNFKFEGQGQHFFRKRQNEIKVLAGQGFTAKMSLGRWYDEFAYSIGGFFHQFRQGTNTAWLQGRDFGFNLSFYVRL